MCWSVDPNRLCRDCLRAGVELNCTPETPTPKRSAACYWVCVQKFSGNCLTKARHQPRPGDHSSSPLYVPVKCWRPRITCSPCFKNQRRISRVRMSCCRTVPVRFAIPCYAVEWDARCSSGFGVLLWECSGKGRRRGIPGPLCEPRRYANGSAVVCLSERGRAGPRSHGTSSQVLTDAVESGARLRVIFKEPTVTPTASQRAAMGLSRPLGSPNGAMRRGWNGICISRDTILIDGMQLGFKRPVVCERQASGGLYYAGWEQCGGGRLLTTFFPNDPERPPTIVDGRCLDAKNSVAVVFHNPLDRVPQMAHIFFSRCLQVLTTPWH